MTDWEDLLRRAGMDQAALATAFDKSPSVISALVANTTGKHAPGKKFRKAALEYLQKRINGSESGVQGRTESAVSGVDRFVDRADDLTPEQWKHRAIFLEDRLKQLQSSMRSALAHSETPLPRVSSKPTSAAATYGAKASEKTKTDPAE